MEYGLLPLSIQGRVSDVKFHPARIITNLSGSKAHTQKVWLITEHLVRSYYNTIQKIKSHCHWASVSRVVTLQAQGLFYLRWHWTGGTAELPKFPILPLLVLSPPLSLSLFQFSDASAARFFFATTQPQVPFSFSTFYPSRFLFFRLPSSLFYYSVWERKSLFGFTSGPLFVFMASLRVYPCKRSQFLEYYTRNVLGDNQNDSCWCYLLNLLSFPVTMVSVTVVFFVETQELVYQFWLGSLKGWNHNLVLPTRPDRPLE